MIEIDDAGGGCFVGPEVLVIHNIDTGAVNYRYIPPEVQERVNYATSQLKTALAELAISKSEPIKLCRGEIFDPFQLFLTEQGYQVVREKVSNATDNLAESKFMEILYSYGFPRNLILENRNYRSFYEWVGCWYHYQPKKLKARIQKARIRPPFWPRRIVKQYPNLVRIMLEDEQVG